MTLNDKFNLQYSCKECGGTGSSTISVEHTDECEVKKELEAERLRKIVADALGHSMGLEVTQVIHWPGTHTVSGRLLEQLRLRGVRVELVQ